jgi:hypothetical protein
MRNRFVEATRYRYDHSPGKVFRAYRPVELRNGNLYALCNREELGADGMMMGIHGFELESDAWRVIDAIESREANDEAEHHGSRSGGSRGDREDFHSDG